MPNFGYRAVARQAGIPDEVLDRWRDVFRRQYPGDEMMVDLRMLRTCRSAKLRPESLRAIMAEMESEERAAR